MTIAYDTKYGKYHYFKCNAPSCKGTGSVRRYQKTDNHSSTSNLRTHAIKCFGKDAVAAAMSGADSSARPDGSIFSAFGRQGARPVTVTHRAHTNAQIRYVLTLATFHALFECLLISVPILCSGLQKVIGLSILSRTTSIGT